MKIIIDWGKIKSEEDFYKMFLPQVKAPNWHGHNLDALNDSIVTSQINEIELPYTIMNINSSQSEASIVNFQRKVISIFIDGAIENHGLEIIIK